MSKSIDYYLSKGFDRKTAEYFSNGRRKPVKVFSVEDNKLLITFDNDENRLFDVSPLIKDGTVYSALKDKTIFTHCYIDSNNSVCWDKNPDVNSEEVWSNKIDIGSDTCYLESVPVAK